MNQALISLSGVYGQEGFLPGGLSFDLTGIEGSCCYCDKQSQEKILAALPSDLPPVRWIDTGDYHYLSFLLMRRFGRPVRLKLIDNHSDDFPDEGCLSCGNWVTFARNEELLTEDPSAPLYLSIDLDALRPDVFVTNWDQGSLGFGDLCREIRECTEGQKIAAIDICGGLSCSKGATPRDLTLNAALRRSLADFLSSLSLSFYA